MVEAFATCKEQVFCPILYTGIKQVKILNENVVERYSLSRLAIPVVLHHYLFSVPKFPASNFSQTSVKFCLLSAAVNWTSN